MQRTLRFLMASLIILCHAFYGYSQSHGSRQIDGQVMDASGIPIPGAGVVVQGTRIGTVSDLDGLFSLDVPYTAKTLEVSALGYLNKVVPIGAGNSLTVVLEDEILSIDQVVVTGYGNGIKKESLTSSISTINSTRLSKSASVSSSSALAGKIAGVNFRQYNGEPGMGTSINIRNMGAALFVIDGVQSTEGSFNNIDFNDIESITVLKDASAAIYGVQASNGVIVVTTKSGKSNQGNHINISASTGMQSWFRYPRPASAADYVEGLIQSATVTGNQAPYTMEQLNGYRNGTIKGFDWYDYVIRDYAPQTYISASAEGGTDKINYYVSLGGLDQESIINGYGSFKRYNVQLNLDSQITEKLKVGMRFNGRIESYKHPAVPGEDVWAAIFAIWRNPPVNRPFANDNPDYPAVTSNTASTNFAILNYDRSGYLEDTYRVGQINGYLEYSILDGLKLKALGSYYYGGRWYECQEYTYDLYSYDEVNDTYPVEYSLTNPFRQRIVSFQEKKMGQLQLTWDKAFGKHSISALGAAEVYHEIAPGLDTWSRPASKYVNTIDFASLEKYTDVMNDELTRTGFAGRINYNYAERYYLELSGRYDGSYKFQRGHRWVFLPSASLGWRISEESFWKRSSIKNWFNSFKLRGSYGILASDDIEGLGPFDYYTGYDYGQGGAVLDGKYFSGAVTKGIPTTSITWVKTNMLDIGADMRFLNDRLSVTVDYFRNKRTGLLGQRYDQLIPTEVGFTLPYENLGSEIYTGVDGDIAWKDRAGEFLYSVGANFTFARKYNWEQYKPRYENSVNEFEVAMWHRYAGISWGYVSDGQFQDWAEIQTCPVNIDGKGNTTLIPGDIKYKDLNNDGVINHYDTRPIGYSQGSLPLLNYGLNLDLQWKGFDLSADFTGGCFGTYRVDYEICRPFWDGGNTADYILKNSWKLVDIEDESKGFVKGAFPMAIEGRGEHSNYWASDFWYTNIAYIKLRNLEFGYTLPQSISQKVAISKARFYLFAQNLFSIDNLGLFEVDPEIAETNSIVYPTTRILGVGTKITF